MGILPFVAELGLVDHHCHGVLRTDSTREEFESLLTEAAAPAPGTTLFDSAVGFAVRKWCAPLLDLPRHVSPEAYLERRNSLHITEVSRTFLTATGTLAYLVDGGFQPDRLLSFRELGDLGDGAEAHEIVRLETLAEEVRASGAGPRAFADAVRAQLDASSAVGAKSVAAYRIGLALEGSRPSDEDVARAVHGWSGERCASEVLTRFLVWEAIERRLPVQFHVGYGDSDASLHRCDPLLLTDFLRATESRGVPILLLHNYPFHRNAGYLAQVFTHVYCDLGLATHALGHQASRVFAEALEIVPFGKFLYSSDAFGLPELYYLGALLFRRALSDFLASGMKQNAFTESDAVRIAHLVASDNARRVYGL
ncbi:amidohydrolase family protein [Lentzea tibetensis]|uniref:Amidohydrolase family protein n=1 Tax=Lentzea tibetensis TaxID=2591470 RepID=A0A563ERA9_9PSEU|nr:amidohydrolase family protein [Lentzea tibetensis]TWP50237.1 amidohydrolase family protein [Lentzea tibetensis]